jgi:hypothetical protein
VRIRNKPLAGQITVMMKQYKNEKSTYERVAVLEDLEGKQADMHLSCNLPGSHLMDPKRRLQDQTLIF